MMRAAVAILALALAPLARAGATAPAVRPTVPLVAPSELAALIRQADSAVIGFESWTNGRQARDAVVTDRAWIDRLAAIVGAGPLPAQPYCLCVSTPSVELYDDTGLIVRLTLHHRGNLRSSGRVSGDFAIGPERSNQMLDLALAQETNAQPRENFLEKLKRQRARK